MEAAEAIRQFIMNDLHWDGSEEQLTLEYLLIENYVIDSLGLFELVAFVQERFGVQLGDDELVPQNFGSIGAIVNLIERKGVPAGDTLR